MSIDSPVILLVEGDILVRHPLAEYLRECGFTVLEAANGLEARTALRGDQSVDVVLADMETEGGGFTLREWIRTETPTVDVVLAGTVEKSVDRAATLCRKGPALAKPYTHHLVLDRIRQQLAARKRSDS